MAGEEGKMSNADAKKYAAWKKRNEDAPEIKSEKKKKTAPAAKWDQVNPFGENMDKLIQHDKEQFRAKKDAGLFGGIRQSDKNIKPGEWALDNQGLRTPEQMKERIKSSALYQKPTAGELGKQAVAAKKGPVYEMGKGDYVGKQNAPQNPGKYIGYDKKGEFGWQDEANRESNSRAFDQRNAPAPVGGEQTHFLDNVMDVAFGNNEGQHKADMMIMDPANSDLYNQESRNSAMAKQSLRNRGGVTMDGKNLTNFRDLDRHISARGGQAGDVTPFPESAAVRSQRNSPGWNPNVPQQAPSSLKNQIMSSLDQGNLEDVNVYAEKALNRGEITPDEFSRVDSQMKSKPGIVLEKPLTFDSHQAEKAQAPSVPWIPGVQGTPPKPVDPRTREVGDLRVIWDLIQSLFS